MHPLTPRTPHRLQRSSSPGKALVLARVTRWVLPLDSPMSKKKKPLKGYRRLCGRRGKEESMPSMRNDRPPMAMVPEGGGCFVLKEGGQEYCCCQRGDILGADGSGSRCEFCEFENTDHARVNSSTKAEGPVRRIWVLNSEDEEM